MSTQICLKWNSFLNNIATSFESLWEEEGLVDVTLTSDGQCLTAHKVILSASSPFFKKVFQTNPCQHPVIILQDVHFSELEALLIFIYKGEVNIEQKNLPALLKAAETLQIRGLSGSDVFASESYKRLAEFEDEDNSDNGSQVPEESSRKKLKVSKNNSILEKALGNRSPINEDVNESDNTESKAIVPSPEHEPITQLFQPLEMKVEPLDTKLEEEPKSPPSSTDLLETSNQDQTEESHDWTAESASNLSFIANDDNPMPDFDDGSNQLYSTANLPSNQLSFYSDNNTVDGFSLKREDLGIASSSYMATIHNPIDDTVAMEQSFAADGNRNEPTSSFLIRSCSGINQQKKLIRKRQTDSSVDIKAKQARGLGIDGIGRKGVPITPRKMREGCSMKCRFKCQTKITTDERKKVFDTFWSLENVTLKRQCISNWTKCETAPSHTHYPDSDETRKKIKSHIFTLPNDNGDFIKVCKTMFLHTLDIGQQWVYTVDNKMCKVSDTFVIEPDLRGKHKTRPLSVPRDVKEGARQHIRSFPTMESHYWQETSNKQYLEEGLNISKMYRMYKEEKQGEPVVSENMYRNIFHTEFNYEFYIPKKDRCEICEVFYNPIEENKSEQQETFNVHLNNKIKVRELMKYDKERAVTDGSICVINFGLQKVLTTPRAEIGPLHYMSKLCVYNFTIYDLAKQDGFCFVWNETVGKRGANEIASYLWKFIKKNVAIGIKEFCLYSDNCGVQNRNKIIFTMFVKAAADFGVLITHRFLEVGHTQCDGDSMHTCIEKHCANKSIFTQQQWCTLMRESKITKPYTVEEIDQGEIYDFDLISAMFNWNQFPISLVREVTFQPFSMTVHVKYDFLNAAKTYIVSKHDYPLSSIQNVVLSTAYNEKMHLSDRKSADLKSMVFRGLIPTESHQFYTDIFDNK